MEDEFIKNLSDEERSELEEFNKRILKAVYPAVVYELIRNGFLDKEKINNREYVATVINENLEKIKLPNIQFATYRELMETLKSEIEANREMSAVIIAGVCIEHLLNHFYQDILPFKYGMSNKEVASKLNSIGILDKIGWFLKTTTNYETPEALKDKVININNIRNKAVHYKAIPQKMDVSDSGSHSEIRRKLESLKLEQLLEVTNELEKFLSELMLKIDDNYSLAVDICNKYLL